MAQKLVTCLDVTKSSCSSNHEQTEQAQKVFFEVGKLSATIKEMSNPFQEETRDLLRQDTNDIAHPAAAEMIGTHLERGRTQFQEFMKGLENKYACKFYEPIKKNRLDLFQ